VGFGRTWQQIEGRGQRAQGRQAHSETIGRVLFGVAPDTAMFAFQLSY
jgi:hypothetical protein